MRLKARANWAVIGGLLACIGLIVAGSVARGSPRVYPAERQQGTREIPDVHVVLKSLPDSYEPKISSSQAVDIAMRVWDVADDPDASVKPVLALFTNELRRPVDAETLKPTGPLLYEDVPVWNVEVNGLCTPVFGGFNTSSSVREQCATTEQNVVIDAETGEIIEDFGYR